jgi:PleD family two-component response regulator
MTQRLVLIADDNTHTQRLLHTALGSCDFRSVSDAEQAFTIATAESTDLIVLNTALAGFDAFQMVQRLKGEASTAFVPVLALTQQPYPELEHEARSAGFDALLILPVTAATLGDVGRLLMTRGMLLRERSAQLLQRGAALRARSATVQREAAAVLAVHDTAVWTAALPNSPKCRRCGSDADNQLVRTSASSATYRCGMCNTQWRWTYKKSVTPTG